MSLETIDPNGPPEPIKSKFTRSAWEALGATGVAALVAVALVAKKPTACRGANRSMKLQWQLRQQQIQAAQQASGAITQRAEPEPKNE